MHNPDRKHPQVRAVAMMVNSCCHCIERPGSCWCGYQSPLIQAPLENALNPNVTGVSVKR